MIYQMCSYLKVLDSVRENRVTIVVGPTGTGKTTQIPLFILDMLAREGQRCNIVVTQPRRLAAVTNATRVASLRRDSRNRPWRVGHLVGYHVNRLSIISIFISSNLNRRSFEYWFLVCWVLHCNRFLISGWNEPYGR